MSVQDLQDELIQDVLVAASTLGNLYGGKREGEREYEPSARPGPEPGASQDPTPRLPHFHYWVEVVLKHHPKVKSLGMD